MNKRIELPNFDQLYYDHVNMVYNLSLTYLKNTELAADISQEVFIKIHAKLSNFKGQSSLKTWIYRITINECLDYLQAQKRKKRFAFFSSITDHSNADKKELTEFNHPGVQLENKEATAAVLNAIDALPDRQKNVLLLHITAQLSHQEIAEIINASPKAVESILGRARINLREIMDRTREIKQ